MNSADMVVLEQVAVTELLAHSHRWSDPRAESSVHPREQSAQQLRALGRLANLGLVSIRRRDGWGSDDGVAITPAGIEALAYLSSVA